MTGYLLERAGHTLLVLLAVTALAFLFTQLSGDPVALMLPPEATREQIEEMRGLLGLDAPLPVQFGRFLALAAQGNFGYSLRYHQPALSLVADRLPATLTLTVASLGVALGVALPIGLFSAIRRRTAWDRGSLLFVLVGQSVPVFWSGMLLILVFAVAWRLLPAGGYESPIGLILPAVTLGLYTAAIFARLLRGSAIEVLSQDYVRTARAKGLFERAVLLRHVFRNTLVPLVTVVGFEFGVLMGGAVVTERVFAWPGVGSLIVEAIRNRDVPLVQASVFVLAVFVSLANLAVDCCYPLIDPRIQRRVTVRGE